MDDHETFPVDEATFLAIEHAMGGALTYDRPADADLADAGPWLVGADYSMSDLLDFIGGTLGRDPDEEVLAPGRDETDLPAWERGIHNAEVVYDTRSHFTRDCVIRALIAEVRRLRTLVPEGVREV